MKSNFIRLFVVTLALAGFGATTTVSAHTTKAHLTTTNKDLPIPLCLPSDPSNCGIH